MSRSQKRLDKLSAGAGGHAAPSVAPLRCPKCNAPVPMGTTDTATCLACGASVPLPDDVRALRDSTSQNAEDRARAEKLYRKLGKPPSALLQAWVSVFVLGAGAVIAAVSALVALGGVALIFVALGLELILHGLAGPFGIDFIDRYGGGTTYAGFAACVLVFGVLPAWLVNYLQSSGELRLQLQANLAAKQPEQPGFPSTCRVCGAALDVAPGQLGVRCAYCGSDNLVALPPEWIARSSASTAGFHKSIVEAAGKATELRKEGRSNLVLIVVIGGIAMLLMAALGHFAVWLDENDDDFKSASYAECMGPPRVMFHQADGSTLAENTAGDVYRADVVALRDGEVLELQVGTACPVLKVFNTTSFPLLQREDAVAFGIAADSTRVARYRAPYTGLFRLDLAGGGTMTWRIAHGPAPALRPLVGCE